MSVLIKGMQMPMSCSSCPCSDDEVRFCRAKRKYIAMFGKQDWCPLVELPEKHGRLIDEHNVTDAIHKRLQTLQTHKEFIKKRGDIDLLGVLPYISKIQTVIEAEGAEE